MQKQKANGKKCVGGGERERGRVKRAQKKWALNQKTKMKWKMAKLIPPSSPPTIPSPVGYSDGADDMPAGIVGRDEAKNKNMV